MNISSLPKSTINLVTSFPSEYVGTVGKRKTIINILKICYCLHISIFIYYLVKQFLVALAALQPNPQNLSRLLDKFSSEKNIPKEELYEVVGVYMAVIKYFIHTTDKDFASNLVEFGFPAEFVNNLSFVNNRKALVNNYLSPHYDYFYNVDSIKWRIDMSLLSRCVTLS